MRTLDEVIEKIEATWVCPSSDEADEYCELYGVRDDALHYLKEYKRISARLEKIALGNITETLEKLDNPAMTWDELKQMEGKPVWVESNDDGKFWCVIDHFDQLDNHINHGEEFMLVDGGGWYYLEDMGTEWQAYRKERNVD